MTAKVNKNNSARKKLIPAIAMLTVSAMTLASSTYAWFTMSREVSVSGIQMAATVPEDLQISLGELTTGGELNKSTGRIKAGDTAGVPVLATDWSNSAIISNYYEIGKLIPASSNDGAKIFFTPDADGVGKTVAGEANYYKAADGLTAQNDNNSGKYMATLHAATSDGKGDSDTEITTSWTATSYAGTKYVKGTTWDKTNDDGYYVDIPVWIRSSSDSAVSIKVDGYVVPQTQGKVVGEADLELYKAARVAILNGDDGTAVQAKNIIPLSDGVENVTYDNTTHAVTAVKEKDNKFDASSSILDSANYTGRGKGTAGKLYGVSDLGTAVQKADKTATYTPATYTEYEAYSSSTATTNVIATIAKPDDGQEYGAAKKLVLRVWLDGEDGECWNQNAGQDFAITLKFSKIES